MVIPFLNIAVHTSACFLSSSVYLMCIIFCSVLYRLFNGNVKKIPKDYNGLFKATFLIILKQC